jgi:TonB-dependent SusC/RagA subfamily outer membrane receptor
MKRDNGRRLATGMAVLSLFAAVWPAAARAQLPFPTGGATAFVIDSAQIAESGAQTLSELLLARVPGLSVRLRGGTKGDGADVTARGMVSPYSRGPMLVIDGVLADGSQSLPVPGTSVALSRLDDLTPADVQRVDVLLGPAASAMYGPGAAAGVIIVTTRHGGAGPLRVEASASGGLTQMAAHFPANYEMTGYSSTDGTPQPCNLHFTQGCVPTTLNHWNPLEQASPFRLGPTATGRAAVSGTIAGTRLYVGAVTERANGVTSDDWESRVAVRASADRTLPGHLTVSARAGYAERRLGVPARGANLTADNVIERGLLGTAYDDSTHGYLLDWPSVNTLALPPDASPPTPALFRVTSALHLQWKPTDWLTVDAVAGQDRARESAARRDSSPVPSDSSFSFEARSDHWTSGTLHAGAEVRYGLGRHLSLRTHAAYDDERVRRMDIDTTAAQYQNVGSWSWLRSDLHVGSQQASVQQHVSWRQTAGVDAGARWWVGHGISAPFGRSGSRNVGVWWQLSPIARRIGVRLRAAAGLAPVIFRSIQIPYLTGYDMCLESAGGCPGWWIHPREGEREAGVDVTFGERTRLQVTYFRDQARDVIVNLVPAVYGNTPSIPIIADVQNRGVEATATTQWLNGAHLAWQTTLTLSTLRNRVTRFTNSSLVGYPLQANWNNGYTWADANNDGLIQSSEVQRDGTRSYVGPSEPTLEIGLGNTLRLRRHLALHALLDYRGGQFRNDVTAGDRCGLRPARCRALQDPATPLEEQARWMALADQISEPIEPASFLRLREVTLEWTAPARTARALGAARLAVRLVGLNLATWTRYPGIDPEVGPDSPDGTRAPRELFTEPLARSILLEVRVGHPFGGA